MTLEETLERWRRGAETRANAHQGAATFDRTLYSILAYSTPVFALLGASTLLTSSVGPAAPGLAQTAAVCSLVAAVTSGLLAVRDLQESEEKHRKDAADYTAWQMDVERVLVNAGEGQRPADDEMKRLIKEHKELDARPLGAPAWIYSRARRAVGKPAVT